MKTKSDCSASVGVFRPDEVYTFAELRRRGFGSDALRQMQREGLLARVSGRQKVVLGADLMNYFENLPVACASSEDHNSRRMAVAAD